MNGLTSKSEVLSTNTVVLWRRFIVATPQASVVIIGEVIAPRFQQHDDRLMRPKDIIADMKTMYDIQVMYRSSIRGFRRCMRPVILVDGTHLKGRFRGTMFVATAQDGNKQVYPIAFGVHKLMPKIRTTTANDDTAEFIRNMLQKWFHDLHAAAWSMRHQLIDAAHLVILKRVEKCNYMTVNLVDWNIFSVKLKGNQWTVNLHLKTCTCNKFQMDHFLCSHALTAARERNLDFTSLSADYYKRETLIDAYSVPIMPVGHPSS
ncbi:hypothetical protein LWI28_027711 [Acer negundo]|uniref:SWIM-type domain-containing protein n=1 Tax=Acer negundo TaxID=4023 RepID=A0AAD5P4Z2_ACENE|nr:hypothetical protein LWI28_027711 [Acer negundo]